jgi:16S rRNA (uracil1498-N3)-methyltransferase
MRQSRVYTDQVLACPADLVMDKRASHYLSRVLRLTAGDAVTLFNGDGRDYQGEVSDASPGAVGVRVTDCRQVETESPLDITLVQAISRGERMDHTLQKATELGVHRIQPVISKRVEVRLTETRRAKRLLHWKGVVISACEQSGRARVPTVEDPLALDAWISMEPDQARLVLAPGASQRLSSFRSTRGSVSLVVGPEGGFTKEELTLLQDNGVQAVSLGPRILRTETAGPAAIAVLQAGGGDF